MTSIPPEIEGKINQLQIQIQQAHALEESRQTDKAQSAYLACLNMASRERIPIMDGQLVEIWIGIGFCHSDCNEWRQALEWYHRAEAALLSTPEFNPNPKSSEARLNAQKWTPYLSEGVQVIFRQNYPAKVHLADLYDSIALAYDNSNQLERAKKYFQLSIDLHRQSGNLEREAQVSYHQAIGCQRRQEWQGSARSAANMLSAADRAQIKPLILIAYRLLAQSQINQNLVFGTIQLVSDAVMLGRELEDAQLEIDEKLLRELIQNIRLKVINQGEAKYLEPIVKAEMILNDVNLSQDMALLQKWKLQK